MQPDYEDSELPLILIHIKSIRYEKGGKILEKYEMCLYTTKKENNKNMQFTLDKGENILNISSRQKYNNFFQK